MTRRCKPGQRARLICGPDKGAIVLIVRRYLGEEVGGSKWPETLFPWVVASLGAPLQWNSLSDPRIKGRSSTIVADDRTLEPLKDDDDGLTRTTDQSLPTPKSIVKTPGAPQGVHEPRPDLKNPEVRAFLSAPKASRADTSRRNALPEFGPLKEPTCR